MSSIKNNVLEGKDGWLFLFEGGQEQFSYLMGIKEVEDSSCKNFASNIYNRLEFCKRNNIIYQHVVFPSKPLLKKKYLPTKYIFKVKSLFHRAYLDKLDESSKVAIFYPLEHLEKIEMKYSTFQKYDTHMTDRAYFEIANYLLDLIGISLHTYPCSINKIFKSGDLNYMLTDSPQYKHEEESIYLIYEEKYKIGNRKFLPSNTNEVEIIHSFKSKTELRLLIFADSFFKDIIKYLEPFFKDILYVRSSTMQYDIIELYQPDVVFTGNAERYLSSVISDLDSDAFLWNLYGHSDYLPSEEYMDAFRANLSYRHHQQYYMEWKKKIKESSVYSLDLKKYEFNRDLKLLESSQSLKIESLGTDPYITYFNVDLKVGTKYILVVNLISSIDTIFQVFYTDNRVKPYLFTENNSVKKVVNKGVNCLYVLLDFSFLGTTLRIDPMNRIGFMEIIDISLDRI